MLNELRDRVVKVTKVEGNAVSNTIGSYHDEDDDYIVITPMTDEQRNALPDKSKEYLENWDGLIARWTEYIHKPITQIDILDTYKEPLVEKNETEDQETK